MKLSEKKHQELYNSIADTILDLRVDLLNPDYPLIARREVDKELFDLQQKVWKNVSSALNIKEK